MNRPALSTTITRNIFVGLMPDAGVQMAIHDYRQRCQWPCGHWLPRPERLHLTLHHLGEVPVRRLQVLRDLLRQARMEPFELILRPPRTLGEIGAMTARRHDGLRAFHGCLGSLLKASGFESTGGTRPHVTLAYRAAGAKPPATAPEIVWIAREFMLIWSQLPPRFNRGHHEILARYGAGVPAQMRLFA